MEIFDRQQTFFQTGKTWPLSHRLEGLTRLEQAILDHRQDILEALSLDLGKSSIDVDIGEIGLLLGEIRRARRQLKSWMKPRPAKTPMIFWPARSYLLPCPLGVVLIMAPWNYPLLLSLCPLVGALAAGNCAILKLSPLAPHSAKIISQLIGQSFPQEWVHVLAGDISEVQQLFSQPLNHVFFTGGRKVGKLVAQACAKKLIPVTLELGGQNPAVVHRDANLTVTAKRVAFGKFFNNAQTCVAPNFIFVHSSIQWDFLAKLQGILQSWNNHSWGKIINTAHWDRLHGLLDGQDVIYGGKGQRDKLLMEPTLILNPSWDSPLMQDEIFGPLLPILKYEDEEQLIRLLASKSSCLAAYLFTGDTQLQEHFSKMVPSGSICINDAVIQINNHHLPFGGVGESGQGRYHGEYSFLTFSFLRPVMKRPFFFDPSLRYPPYTATKQKWLRRIL